MPGLKDKDFEYGQMFDVPVPLKPEQPEEPVPISDTALEAVLREATGVYNRPLTQRALCSLRRIQGSTDIMWQSVSDITPLRYCLNLEVLKIFGAQVSDLAPLSGLSRLAVLVVDNTAVSDMAPLRGMTGLGYLELRGNQIADISAVQTLPQLSGLDVSYNRITDLSPILGLSNLNVLRISNNLVKDASGFAEMAQHLKDKDFDPAQPLPQAGGADGGNAADAAQPAQVENPDKVIRFADSVMEQRVRAAMGKPEGDITAGEAAAVENLNLGNEWQDHFPKGSQISNLAGIEAFVNLKSLDISWNLIKDIRKLAGLSNLENLRAFGNRISNITPLAGLTKLRNLNIGGNKIKKIDTLKGLVNLTSLYLSDNPIRDFSPIEEIYPKLTEKDFTLD